MNDTKNVFSIKDLENFSGIKAHTIRIWEKRYNILEPMRTGTNIRYYDLLNLQKLLNITLLHNHGYKISNISKYPPEKIPLMVKDIISEKSAKHHAINAFKMAMINFDQVLFLNTYNQLLSKKSFREVFHDVFIPLMNEIGLLWQTETISSAHEHFIVHLIKQKLITNTEEVQIKEPAHKDKTFVLYLPVNETHELGLIYLNYEILYHGYKTIYLGENIPLENLKDMKKYFNDIVFVSYLTIEPDKDGVNDYLSEAKKMLLKDNQTELWLFGIMTHHINEKLISPKTILFSSFSDFIKKL